MKPNFYLFLELNGVLYNSPVFYKGGLHLNLRSVKALNTLILCLNKKYNVNLRIISENNKILQYKNLMQNNGLDFSCLHSFSTLPKCFFQKRAIVSFLKMSKEATNFAVIDNGVEVYPTRFNPSNVISVNKTSGVLEEHEVHEFLDKLNLSNNNKPTNNNEPEF